jgi:hypothetical protein
MAIRSRVVEDVAVMVAIVVGMPVGMLFLAVLYYCCLEWLHDTLVSRQWLPTKPMRTIASNP